ncbi:DUF5333 domain-containing protein [Aestuariicoccus sp. MJ-SS9]|uniref:DUF5333 domain-containing protein n=1 Tax=Aestuariicoccus sp. MJ-SS9 TaxID=3079855 RepID=UPI002906A5F9|nr:DUF5333 domain-containing protein [Aestuariicoccus sp. MJ-SS9]MDU8910557.1 DUF5333 domain-containing protein [Aestuariicoccus sp. MJ-SS9]
MRAIPGIALALVLASGALAKVPLRDVAEIDNSLMAVAIADEIRKTCDGISARMFRALGVLNALKNHARDLGYTDDEIEAYVTSKAEKARMRDKATAYLAERGVVADDKSQLCAFGREEIARGGPIGDLLR